MHYFDKPSCLIGDTKISSRPPLLFGSGKYQKKTDIPSKPIFRASGLTSGAKIRQVACIGFVSEMVPEKSIFGRFSI
jgi:hypothetical protein